MGDINCKTLPATLPLTEVEVPIRFDDPPESHRMMPFRPRRPFGIVPRFWIPVESFGAFAGGTLFTPNSNLIATKSVALVDCATGKVTSCTHDVGGAYGIGD